MAETYREKYNAEICIIPKSFDIHHLDGNRKNNNLENLLMLPKEIHQKYHKLIYLVNNLTLDMEILSILEKGHANTTYISHILESFTTIMLECNKWKDYKMYCLNLIPNIHKIKIEEYYYD